MNTRFCNHISYAIVAKQERSLRQLLRITQLIGMESGFKPRWASAEFSCPKEGPGNATEETCLGDGGDSFLSSDTGPFSGS